MSPVWNYYWRQPCHKYYSFEKRLDYFILRLGHLYSRKANESFKIRFRQCRHGPAHKTKSSAMSREDGWGCDAYFHTECWRIYQRDKANKRRCVRYADKDSMEKQKGESVKAAKAANLAAKNAGTSPMKNGNEPKSKRPRKDEEPTRISKEL